MQKKLLVGVLLFTGLSTFAQIKWPVITQTTKPWTRWWWEGSAVNKTDLTWNLELYKKAGLGGVEITPIYGIHGYENQFVNFLTPQWMQLLEHTLSESKRLGMGVDMANATGWPFGGPWVTDADAAKSIYFKTYALKSGEQLNEPVEYVQAALVRTTNNKQVSSESLVQPFSANKDLQALAMDQVKYEGKLPLQSLMAYSDDGAIEDLTNKVDANGKLNWTAGNGKWSLYALFEGLHGKIVERAAPGGEGYAIDHFSATAARNYFHEFDKAFKGHDISYLRAFFNDSYEVDDARGEANWTPDFFAEFKKRMYYDLRDHLPALFGKDKADKNSRVLYDYRAVIGELILEHFTAEWKKWGSSKGAKVRNQSHGSPGNTLDLYSIVDIPETEGNDVLRFKFASSAANVTGKKLTSSESATWLNEHFLSSWGDVKKAIDLYFLGGVNHIFYHGTAYSPKDAPWPGWLFYAAVHFQPTNPQWKDFHVLNEYITRVQSFLQQGKPDNDILVYYPIADRYSEPGKELLQHFDGMGREFAGTDFEKISKRMLDNGYSFDFFSDKQLLNITGAGKSLLTGGSQYQTILLPDNEYLPLASFQKIMELAKNGATILVYKSLPKDVPGLSKLVERSNAFKNLIAQLKFSDEGEMQKAIVGKGCFLMGNNIDNLLEKADVKMETIHEKGLQFMRRKNANGLLYFINNRSDNEVKEWVTLNAKASAVVMFDAMTNKAGLANWRKSTKGTIEVLVQLKPFESAILQLSTSKKSGSQFPYIQLKGEPQTINGLWTLGFLDGGPKLPASATMTEPRAWTSLNGEDYQNFSGTAKYTVSFAKPIGKALYWQLDLGKVNETAEVILNGKRIATLIGPTFQCVFPASLLQQNNKLEIIVANLMANRITYMDKNKLPWKIFYNTNMPARKKENSKNGLFDASEWKPLPSGLSDRVTLTAASN
ncbi:MAG: glycosyl hydrolase [Ferruginibacter sp.]